MARSAYAPGVNPRWVRLSRVLVIFALCGWIAGALVLGSDEDATFLGSLTARGAFRGAIAAALGALVWSPLLAWGRLRWHLGMLVGLLAGLAALFLFFFLWPPEMQEGRFGAWKTTGLFITVYWRFLVPSALIAGGVGAEWTRRPVRKPRWQHIADGDDLPEIPIPAPPPRSEEKHP